MRPLEYTQITSFHWINWLGMLLGAICGGTVGWKYFNLVGACVCGFLGLFLGGLPGLFLERWAAQSFFKRIEESSNEELWAVVNKGTWNFHQTMALLYLSGRGEDVRPKLEYILTMLESIDVLERVYGWDALRLVFPAEAKRLDEYDPKSSTSKNLEKIKNFRFSNK